ncbi:MAG: glycoside hydrolase family 2 protein [Phycisphaerae bacterium]
MPIPRNGHPRPQWVRQDWRCLNGRWQFEIDSGNSGLERGLLDRQLADEIVVPFCPESELSGVGNTDFLNAVWYRRDLDVPAEWNGRRVLLHFQAVDYDATVWVNGHEVVRHRGGFTPFSADITAVAPPGQKARLVLRARDDHRPFKPVGKQSSEYHNHGCHYTRTTGIWQTVWLEAVGRTYMDRPRITPDLPGGRFLVECPLKGDSPAGLTLRATLSDDSGVVAEAQTPADCGLSPALVLEIPPDRRRLWSPAAPFLYDLHFQLIDADGIALDKADSYAGLRAITIDGSAVRINGEAVFQRLVLDQGYYPDGIMTAPSDEALVRDIELSLEAGFNGARLHQKVFEERFLYHADRLGYLVWGEFADWRLPKFQDPRATWITQWIEAVQRDYNHPAIVGWCPMNETQQPLDDEIHEHDDVMIGAFLATRAADATRPVLDVSGYCHRVGDADVWDCHDYSQNPEVLREHHAGLPDGRPFECGPGERKWSVPFNGQPFFVSEFGGIWWNPEAAEGEDSWGYGDRPTTEEEFYRRFEALTEVLLENPGMFGYCYTQLTDVYQEQNGIYRFDRSGKLNVARIAAAQQRPAAVERNA